MESLLRWSIENMTVEEGGSRPPPEPRQDLDPGIIDLILGKPDAVLMKEALAVGMDTTIEPEARVTALDDLEMLVEQIDNATSVSIFIRVALYLICSSKIDLAPLNMYPQILSLLSPTSPDPVRMQALWILGTAVQNNPKAQTDFLTHDPLPTILSILSPLGAQTDNPPSAQTRSKAAYALSAALKHSATALSRMGEAGGWNVLRDALQDSDITIRRKIAFLINSLLLPTSPPPSEFPTPNHSTPESGPAMHLAPSPTALSANGAASRDEHPIFPPGLGPTTTSPLALAALRSYGIVPALVESLTAPLPFGPDADEEIDSDYAEKAARALVTYLEVGGVLTSEEKSQLKNVANSSHPGTQEAWQLDEKVWDVLKQNVASV